MLQYSTFTTLVHAAAVELLRYVKKENRKKERKKEEKMCSTGSKERGKSKADVVVL